jgi:hypothetical protein
VEPGLVQLELGIDDPIADHQGRRRVRMACLRARLRSRCGGGIESLYEIGDGGGRVVDPEIQLAAIVAVDKDDLHASQR